MTNERNYLPLPTPAIAMALVVTLECDKIPTSNLDLDFQKPSVCGTCTCETVDPYELFRRNTAYSSES